MSSSLPTYTGIKVTVEANEDIPTLGEEYCFLKAAMQMKQQGPVDFSENIHEYLNADKLDHHDTDQHEDL